MAKTFYGVVGNLLKKGTVIPAWSSLLTEVDWATPEDQEGLTRVDDEHVVREQATCGRDVQPNVAVDKLIRACSVDPPVKYTVVRALGCAHGQAVLRGRRQPSGRGAGRHVDAWLVSAAPRTCLRPGTFRCPAS